MRDIRGEFLSASAASEYAKFSQSSPGAKGRFTNAFIAAMKNLIQEFGVLTTVQFHSYMVSEALHFNPALLTQPFLSSDWKSKRPIQLTPLLAPKLVSLGKGKAPSNGPPQPKMIPKEARVLVSISLDSELKDAQQSGDWLKSPERPCWIREIKVVGSYPSQSTRM